MRLDHLLANSSDIQTVAGIANCTITNLTCDSREVIPGSLFVAIRGAEADGFDYIEDALRRGAAAIATERHSELTAIPQALIGIADSRRFLAKAAARFYTPIPRRCVAVTGTSGKTSVASMARALNEALGFRAASIGTLGVKTQTPITLPSSLTTPDPANLHHCLARLAKAGIDDVILEASSHGLDQHRLDGLIPIAAAFTNFSRDHLDYHHNMDAYLAAKTRLFTELLAPQGIAVLVDPDDPASAAIHEICRARGSIIRTIGQNPTATTRWSAKQSDTMAPQSSPQQELTIQRGNKRYRTSLPLIGQFQALNAITAAELVLAAHPEIDPGAVYHEFANLEPVPGRLQYVAHHHGAPIYIDYAHKPDALRRVLTTLRPLTKNNLTLVFGCGGERDPGKRPLMGEIAQEKADIVIITDDNPRREDPHSIRQDIAKGAPNAIIIPQRRDAISSAIAALSQGDTLLVAGKGHETGQIIGTSRMPFDDSAVIRKIIAAEPEA